MNKGNTLVSKILFIAQIISIIGGIIVPFVIFKMSQKEKEISITIDNVNKVADLTDTKDLSIKYVDLELKNLYSIEYTIKNTGTEAITRDDFNDEFGINLNFNYNHDCKVILGNPDSNPQTMSLSYKHGLYYFSILPDLINSNEYIKLTLYCSYDKSFYLPQNDTRIINGKVKLYDKANLQKNNIFLIKLVNSSLENFLYWITLIFNFVLLGLFFWAIFLMDDVKLNIKGILAFLVFSFFVILNILFFIANK